MNMRTLAAVLGTATATCLVTANFTGCLIVGTTSSSSGTGGDTGSGGFSSSGSNTASSNTTSSSTTSSSTGGMCGAQGSSCSAPSQCCKGHCNSGACDCDPNYKCATAITNGGDPMLLCDGSNSASLYDAYYNCACMGKCMAQCGTTYCGGMGADPPCDMCLQDTVAGCGNDAQACQNDL